MRFFIWLAFKKSYLCGENKKRNRVDISCGICGHGYEDVLHVLRDCSAARGIRNQLFPMGMNSSFFAGFLQQWIEHNLNNQHSIILEEGINWLGLFEILILRIWKNRNFHIFQGLPWSHDPIIKASLSWGKTICFRFEFLRSQIFKFECWSFLEKKLDTIKYRWRG